MDQHTFLELVVLGAAIALSGYIGYAVGHSRGYASRSEENAALETAYANRLQAGWEQQTGFQPDSTVYYGNDVHGGFRIVDSMQNDLYAGQRYTQDQLRPMTKEELRKFSDPYDRS